MPQFLHLFTNYLLKTIICTILIASLLLSCQSRSKNARVISAQDSTGYRPPTPAALPPDVFNKYNQQLATYFEEKLLRHGFNGGILVAKEGNIIYEHYAGRIDLRKPDPMTDSTPMHLASVGKTFTAVAILRMAQDHKLSLDDTLGKYFPNLPYPGISLRMLLSHRSGLPNYVYFIPESDWDKKTYATNADVLNFLYTKQPAKMFVPNKRFHYCNTNFVLLALIIEKISGMPYPQYMKQTIFDPLHMDHTHVFTMADSATATQSFNYNNSHWQYDCTEGTYGDKNIYSTPRDLLKWDQALYTEEMLNNAMLDSAFAPNSLEHPSMHNYGLGFRMLLIPNGKKVIYHFGRWHGFNAAFARLTDEKVTIIILGNKYSSAIYSTARDCYDLFGNYLQKRGDQYDDSEGLTSTPSGNPQVEKVFKVSSAHPLQARR